VPSTPADAAGLLLAAIEAPGPVVFLEHKLLSEQWLDYLGGTTRDSVAFDVPASGAHGDVADEPAPVPLGRAALRREGSDVAMISLGVGVHRCIEAAEQLSVEGVSAAVLDLRSVAPLDRDAIAGLAERTGRVLVVDEDYTRGGLSGEVAALLAEEGVATAYARVTTGETIPYARTLEAAVLPNVARIVAAARRLMAGRPATDPDPTDPDPTDSHPPGPHLPAPLLTDPPARGG
jgi:pyruvate dehydrogenase E1 component beta subunit